MIVPDISVVLPVSKRADDLGRIVQLLRDGLAQTGKSYEILMIVDGELTDRLAQARRAAEGHDDVRVLRFARRFGEGAALQAGLHASRAPVVVTHPAYFQVAGDVIPRLVKALDEGADVAFASRLPSSETAFNRIQRWCFNALVRRFLKIDARDVACGVRALRREVLEEITAHGAFHRFITVAAMMSGFVVEEIDAPLHPDAGGTRAYSPATYVTRALDIMNVFFVTKFLHKPLRFFGAVGCTLLVPGLLICLYLSGLKIFTSASLGDRPLFLFGVILTVLGFQILAIGLLGEIISFSQAARKKPYAIREVNRKEAKQKEPAKS